MTLGVDNTAAWSETLSCIGRQSVDHNHSLEICCPQIAVESDTTKKNDVLYKWCLTLHVLCTRKDMDLSTEKGIVRYYPAIGRMGLFLKKKYVDIPLG